MVKERLNWIDCLKGYGILLVILGHILPVTSPLEIYIQSFHMPFFFMITGVLHSVSKKWKAQSFKEYTIKKTKSLLWPYLTFSILVLVYYLIMANIGEVKEIIKDTVSLNGYKTLWFLTTLFFAEILFYCINNLKTNAFINLGVLLLLTFVTVILFNRMPNLSGIAFILYKYINMFCRILVGTTFIYIGYFLKEAYDRIENRNIKSSYFLVISLLSGIVAIIVGQKNGLVNMHVSQLNSIFMFYIVAILIFISYFILFKYVVKRQKFLEYCGRNTIIIMVTHYCIPITMLVSDCLLKIYKIDNYLILSLIVWFITIIIEVCITFIINKKFRFIVKL